MQQKDTLKVWVVVALSRPQLLPFVYWQFQRMTHQNKSLLIVESKKGKGACLEHSIIPSVLLQNDGTAGQCRNMALDYLDEKKESGYWVTMDDDDFYGPSYISKHLDLYSRTGLPLNIGNYEYVVMNEAMVKFDVSSETVQGCSIGGELPCLERYGERPVGEEVDLLGDGSTVGRGSLPVAVSRLGCPLNHTWKAHSKKIWLMHDSGHLCTDGNVYEQIEGQCLPDKETVNYHNRLLMCKGTPATDLGLPDGITYEI